MKKLLLALLAAVVALWVPELRAQSADVAGESGDLVRVMRHPDGTRSIYQRQKGWKGMRCLTYAPSGKLGAIYDYTEGKYGHLVSCIIYDSKRTVIYKVAYGYDSRARLVEERMFTPADSKNPGGKLVQRVIYKYDSSGNRSKPIIVSLNTGKGIPSQDITPTMKDDVNRINAELKRSKR